MNDLDLVFVDILPPPELWKLLKMLMKQKLFFLI